MRISIGVPTSIGLHVGVGVSTNDAVLFVIFEGLKFCKCLCEMHRHFLIMANF